jgi:hypothetical protein
MASNGLFCHSVTCSVTALVILETSVADMSAPYISWNASTISRVVIPLV